MTTPTTEHRTLDVSPLVTTRIRMDDAAKRMQERDSTSHTGSARWQAEFERRHLPSESLFSVGALIATGRRAA